MLLPLLFWWQGGDTPVVEPSPLRIAIVFFELRLAMALASGEVIVAAESRVAPTSSEVRAATVEEDRTAVVTSDLREARAT